MSDYTKKNFLQDIKNSAEGQGVDGLEAHFGRSAIDSEHLGLTMYRLAPNVRVPWGHRHREQEEVYVVVSGSGGFRLDGETVEIRQWDLIRVAPNVGRAFEAGPDGLEIIAVGNDRPEGGDAEMVEGLWED